MLPQEEKPLLPAAAFFLEKKEKSIKSVPLF